MVLNFHSVRRSALAPLGYRYIGQIGNQIGFGIEEAEFFISQETASIKASAAHIAFSALSRSVVDAFFVAALKAGGRIHGEPAERDPATGYYSAAVLDFDQNSIEVMHRSKGAPDATRSNHDPEPHRVLSWQKEVAKSTVSQSPQPTSSSPRVVVTNITKPTIMISDPSSQAAARSDVGSKALIGTLLGAAAGAAVAYAMSKGDEGNANGLGNITYQAVEAAKSYLAPSDTEPQRSHPHSTFSGHSQRQPPVTEYPRSQLSIAAPSDRSSSHSPAKQLTITAPPPPAQASTLIDTFVPSSEVPRYRRHSLSRSRTDGAVPSIHSSRGSSSRSRLSRAHSSSSSTKTVTQADLPTSSSRHSSSTVHTELRHPRDVPLPASKATSTASKVEDDLRRMVLDRDHIHHDEDAVTVLESVAPSDSVSQAGSKRSRASRQGSRHGSSRRGDGKDNEEEASEVSAKTVKARGSRRPSIVSAPVGAEKSERVRRGVLSLLGGM
ncbi:MAG: hypothetical protein L6R40_002291 [Gallowayella cf. fulva]|nr:MAG: hypothetical protein L6R40_002291 [Xanthomendoza cf. fulva]